MTQDMTAVNPHTCPDGLAHQWDYLGKQWQQYRCHRCGQVILKERLQEATTPQEVV